MIKATFVGKFSIEDLKKCMGILRDVEEQSKKHPVILNTLKTEYGRFEYNLMFKIQFKHLTNEVSHVTFKSISEEKLKANMPKEIEGEL